MRVVAVHNAKGGVGKTTLATNVAYLASRTQRTILIDADPQGNASSYFIKARDYRYELADVLSSDGAVSVQSAIIKVDGDLHMLATRGLAGGLKNYGETKLIQEPLVFDDLNGILNELGFELVVYDLSPGLSQLERCVILAANEVVIPVEGELFSIEGVESAVQAIELINRKFKRGVTHKRLVINKVNQSFRRHVESLDGYRKLTFEIFVVPQDSKVAEAQFAHEPLALYAPASRALPEFERLTVGLIGGNDGSGNN
jgi:cellulose biosynthesis protein BcsQ